MKTVGSDFFIHYTCTCMNTYMFMYNFAGTLPSMQSGLSWRGHLYSSGRIQDVAGCGPRAEDS